jgi:hypothetical protein
MWRHSERKRTSPGNDGFSNGSSRVCGKDDSCNTSGSAEATASQERAKKTAQENEKKTSQEIQFAKSPEALALLDPLAAGNDVVR